MDVNSIKRMSRLERLQAMESLWDSLFDEEPEIESPEWHGGILKERKKLIESGEAEWISLEDLKANRNE